MNNQIENTLACIVSLHQTLSICSKCLECCNEKDRVIYGGLAQDTAKMIYKLKNNLDKLE
ncbi:hypothetical protein ABD70_14600 [Alkalihalobacillus lehensis]|nr:hypothetical protein [Shouchella lehensis]